MKITIIKEDVVKMSKQVKAMYNLIANAHISLEQDKFILIGQDSANISIMSIEVNCKVERGYDDDIFIKMEDFTKVCKMLKDDTIIEIKDNKFFINTGKKEFVLPLYVEDEDRQYYKTIPQVDSDLTIEIKIDDIEEALSDTSVVSDNEICFNVVNNILYLSAEDGIKKSNSKLVDNVNVKDNINIVCKFSQEYVSKAIDCVQEDIVTLHLKTDRPLLIVSNNMKFVLAPRANEKND